MKAVTFHLYVKNLANAVYFQNSSSRLDAFRGRRGHSWCLWAEF
jgi:hypothetical protein